MPFDSSVSDVRADTGVCPYGRGRSLFLHQHAVAGIDAAFLHVELKRGLFAIAKVTVELTFLIIEHTFARLSTRFLDNLPTTNGDDDDTIGSLYSPRALQPVGFRLGTFDNERIVVLDHCLIAELVERLVDALLEHGLLVGAVAKAVADGEDEDNEHQQKHDEAVAKTASASPTLLWFPGRDGVLDPLVGGCGVGMFRRSFPASL